MNMSRRTIYKTFRDHVEKKDSRIMDDICNSPNGELQSQLYFEICVR